LLALMLHWATQNGEEEFRNLLLFGYRVGARQNEFLKLTLKRSSEKQGYIDGDFVVFPHPNPLITNKGMRRDVLLHPDCLAVVRHRLREAGGGNALLFPTLTKSRINKLWKRMMAVEAIKAEHDRQWADLILADGDEPPKDAVFHSLRHEFCSRLGEAGWSSFELMRQSGHKTEAAVRRYVKISRDHAAERMRQLHATAGISFFTVFEAGQDTAQG
jgi:integrase